MEGQQLPTGVAGPRPGIRRRASAWGDPPAAAPWVPEAPPLPPDPPTDWALGPPAAPAGSQPWTPETAGPARWLAGQPLVLPSAVRWGRDARVVATVLGILAGLGLVGATLSFTVDLFVAPWRIFTLDVEESLHLLASLIGLVGAFQLYRGARRGRPVVLAGLALNAAATPVFSSRTLGSPDTLVPMLTWLALAGLTVACRRRQDPDLESDWTPRGPGVSRYPWPPPPPQ